MKPGLPGRRGMLVAGGIGIAALTGLTVSLCSTNRAKIPVQAKRSDLNSLPTKPEYALSLRFLQQQLEACPPAGCPDEIRNLFGLTQIGGYVLDEKNRDIVLFGVSRPGEPALDLDDFVIGLRSVHMRYIEVRDNKRYFSPPGISIDPQPESIRRLNVVGKEFGGKDDGEAERLLRLWQEICRDPQDIRVMGVPRNTGFAKVMFEADYLLKSVADGSVDLGLPGFTSLMQQSLEKGIAAAERNQTIAFSSASRFWLSAGETSYSSGLRIVALNRADVQLLSEEEFATTSGQLRGTGKPAPLSEQFARDFSARYSEIVVANPIYRRLQDLFRWVALSRLIVDEKAAERSGAEFTGLLDRHVVRAADVPETVAGRSNTAQYDGPGYRLTLPSCGGVLMRFDPGSLADHGLTAEAETTVVHSVLSSRPARPGAAFWRVS